LNNSSVLLQAAKSIREVVLTVFLVYPVEWGVKHHTHPHRVHGIHTQALAKNHGSILAQLIHKIQKVSPPFYSQPLQMSLSRCSFYHRQPPQVMYADHELEMKIETCTHRARGRWVNLK
jgi:hypothetical protein